MSLAGLAAGADGLMIEVHPNPEEALSDGMQSLHFDEFEDLMNSIKLTTKESVKMRLRLLTLRPMMKYATVAGTWDY